MVSLTPQLRSVLTAISLSIGAYLVGNVVVLLALLSLPALGVAVASAPSLRLGLSTVLLQGVGFGGVAVAYLKLRNLEFRFAPFSVPDLRDLAVTAAGFAGVLAILFAASATLSALGVQSAQNRIVEIGQRNPNAFLVLIPLSFLLVGPAEELLYRGVVQGLLREYFHPIRAIVLASALFAAIHVFSLTGDGKFVYVGMVFALALVLGGIYEYTGNLTVPALVHGAYNAFQFASVYVQSTGGL